MGFFPSIPLEMPDPIYGLQINFKKDLRPEKINLSIGALYNDLGELLHLDAVREAEKIISEKKLNKEYLPIDGLALYRAQAENLVLGNCLPKDRASYTAQTVGGTCAIYLAARFLFNFGIRMVYIPDPTWVNHRRLFEAAGLTVSTFPYLTTREGSLNVEEMLKAIANMKEGSIILLHASCHNPTGLDPSLTEWQAISDAVKKRNLLPIIDSAYQGLGNGLNEDIQGLRVFVENGHDLFITHSFSKNFGLYSDRIGTLTVVCSKNEVSAIESQLKKLIRITYSSPPAHGAYIVSTILSDKTLTSTWEKELSDVRKDLNKIRKSLFTALDKRKIAHFCSTILNSTGPFILTSIPKEKILAMREKDALYLGDDGRINIAAVPYDRIEKIGDLLANYLL